MNCPECGEMRDLNLKYCDNCGTRQISAVGAVDLFLVLWFVLLIPVFLGESVIGLGPGDDQLGLFSYLLIAGADAILVVVIFLYGGRIAERIGGVVHT